MLKITQIRTRPDRMPWTPAASMHHMKHHRPRVEIASSRQAPATSPLVYLFALRTPAPGNRIDVACLSSSFPLPDWLRGCRPPGPKHSAAESTEKINTSRPPILCLCLSLPGFPPGPRLHQSLSRQWKGKTKGREGAHLRPARVAVPDLPP